LAQGRQISPRSSGVILRIACSKPVNQTLRKSFSIRFLPKYKILVILYTFFFTFSRFFMRVQQHFIDCQIFSQYDEDY